MSRSLPGLEFADLLRPHIGDVTAIHPTRSGGMSDLTALVEAARGRFFIKAIGNRPGGRRDSRLREAAINPHVQPIFPPLLWRAENPDWLVLGFQAVDARPADLTPGSKDPPVVVDILNRIAALPLPEIARDWVETRWDHHMGDETQVELLRGDALLYTDFNPGNLLIGRQTAWAVDWAWPTRGAGWIDPALLAVQLIAEGHTPGSAESWAARCTAWESADSQAVAAFAAANARLWRRHAERAPAASWVKAMAAAARMWAEHRSRVIGMPLPHPSRQHFL